MLKDTQYGCYVITEGIHPLADSKEPEYDMSIIPLEAKPGTIEEVVYMLNYEEGKIDTQIINLPDCSTL